MVDGVGTLGGGRERGGSSWLRDLTNAGRLHAVEHGA